MTALNTELAARVAAAAAVLVDYQRDLTEVKHRGTYWSDRLASHLQLVLEMADLLQAAEVDPDDDAGARLAQIRAVFEVFDWETDDRQYALEEIEDIALRRVS